MALWPVEIPGTQYELRVFDDRQACSGRSECRPILTLRGYSADIAEVLPAEIDAVIQNMGQRSTNDH